MGETGIKNIPDSPNVKPERTDNDNDYHFKKIKIRNLKKNKKCLY